MLCGVISPEPVILAASDDFAVVDKPSGMLSVPGKGPDKADCVVARVRERFPHARGPLVVHRLDMDTSGLLVLGLNPHAQRELSRQFEAREVEKHYIALVEGIVIPERGEIDFPIRPDIENRPMQIHDPVHGRAARTRYTVLAHETDRTRLRFEPLTGRSHQLRVHAAHRLGLGRPILGDVLYGDPSSAERLMLHASRLVFTDPGTGRRAVFESPPPF